ncbi:MAG: hypothetical protein IIZ78_27505 [Clostridiales bacterium]|nr:hypothetical protein [Clostridiales bacterium]
MTDKEKIQIQKKIAEINTNIRNGINYWADFMLLADADEWAVHLKYYPRDIVNACMIFQHICSNVGIKALRIDEQKAEDFGKRLRQLVIDMTGYDPADIVRQMKKTTN